MAMRGRPQARRGCVKAAGGTWPAAANAARIGSAWEVVKRRDDGATRECPQAGAAVTVSPKSSPPTQAGNGLGKGPESVIRKCERNRNFLFAGCGLGIILSWLAFLTHPVTASAMPLFLETNVTLTNASMRIPVIALCLLAIACLGGAAHAADVYQNDFQTSAGPEWSATTITATPAPADGSRRFLGPFDNGTVTLTLQSLAAHSQVGIEFDLYVIGSWDGINSAPYGPDRWTLAAAGGPTLLDTSFSNVTSPPFGIPFQQNFPDAYGTTTHAQFTGASETRTLGYLYNGYDISAVYHLAYTLPDIATTVAFQFTAAMNDEYGSPHNINEESWGLDNVHVTSDAVAGVAPGTSDVTTPMRVSPNPFTGSGTLSFGRAIAEQAASLSVLDLTGRVLQRRSLPPIAAGQLQFSMSGMAPGIYFARLDARDGRALGTARFAVVR
jgi:hypothetical protein